MYDDKILKEMIENFPLIYYFSCNQEVTNSAVGTFLGMPDSPDAKVTRPLYYTCDQVEFRGLPWVAVVYAMYFDMNPGYSCNIGKHVADVERVLILFDEWELKPRWVYFGAHGMGQGVWRAWERCETTYVGRDRRALNVYVSPQSHGMYPKESVYWRVFGVANDVCNADGESWVPGAECRCNARTQAWSVEPYQVRRGINTPAHITHPKDRSITGWERFWLALPWVGKRVRTGKVMNVTKKLLESNNT